MTKLLKYLSFEKLVDKAALFGKNAFNYSSGQVAIDHPIAADPQSMVAGQLFSQSQPGNLFVGERADCQLYAVPRLGRETAQEIPDLLPHLNPAFHSAISSSE